MRCTAVRFHGRAAGDRHVQSVRAEPASLRPRAARGACVRSGTMQRHPWGLVSLDDVCGAGCAVQEGGRAVGALGGARSHCEGARRAHAVRMPCYRAARIRTPPRPQRLGGKLLGFRHTARRRLRRAVCEGAGAGGRWSWMRWALRTPSPLLLRGAAWRWGVAMGSAPEAIDTVVSREEAAANY